MFRRRGDTPQIEAAVVKAVNYEVSLADVVRRSERRAWFVALAAILMALILAGGYLLILPLKERTPFLVMADAYTGTATVARLRDNFANHSITRNEAVNKSNISHYVIARESYDLAQRNIRDWNTVYTMSTPDLASSYNVATYSRSNPNSLLNQYGAKTTIRVEILSIQLLDTTQNTQGPGTGGGDATVRFRRLLVEKSGGLPKLLDTRVANLRFYYDNNLALSETQRFDNPLGFRVSSYRVDTELLSNPVLQADPQTASVTPALGQQFPGAAPMTGGEPLPGQQGAPGQAALPQQAAPAATMPQGAQQSTPRTSPNNTDGASNR